MTYPPEHNQQLNAYLQAWRQVLEPLTPGITAAMPFPSAPWGMPPMPPFTPPIPTAPPPPAPPMPADYTQQLFGYLQAWRQYLEHATGAQPAPAQPSSTFPAMPDRRDPAETTRPAPPDRDDGSRTTPAAGVEDGGLPAVDRQIPAFVPRHDGGQLPSAIRPTGLSVRPAREDQSIQVNPDSFGQAAARARGTLMGMPPGVEFRPQMGDQRRLRPAAEPPTQRPTGSPVGGPVRPAVPAAQVRAAGPLFPGLAERAAARIQRDLG
ncbi:hypothetical protein [Mycolicibacterium hippocampi]|uniref:hypothetical protein n=1 Tax=Mycobacterium sp. DL TaxID=3145017 RepID=UPI0021163470|nr:hypothetical protein [Mycolicibacterium hippocampi]